MPKYMEIKFSNGDTFRIPAQVIAESRARNYSQLDFDRGEVSDLDAAYQHELEYSLNDDMELEDWFANNMLWSDVVAHARLMPKEDKPVDYASEFTNAECRLVESEG
jgi:hypothetical protein